jgi:arylsulfatase A-like enzyme
MTTEKTFKKPNIIMILLDDMGWKDFGCTAVDFMKLRISTG